MTSRIVLAVLALWIAVLAGCNTMQGMGRDIEAAGEAIQKKAK